MSPKATVTPVGAATYNLPKGATVEHQGVRPSRVPGSTAMFLRDVTYKGEKITPSMTLGSEAVLKSSTKSKKI